jgi:hypothetical protein
MLYGGDDAASDSNIWVKHFVSYVGQCEYQSLHEFHWELTGMLSLLHMIVFYVWKYPNITRVLAERVAGQFASARSFEVALSGIFGGNSYGIEIKGIVIALGEPKNRFVPP